MGGVRRLWRGELPLVNAFWDWAVIGMLAVNLSTTFLFFVLLSQGWTLAAFAVGYAFSVSYNLLVAVGLWRAAGRYDGAPRWARLARGYAVLVLPLVSLT